MAGTGKSHLRNIDNAAVRVEDLVVEFPARHKQTVHAVSGVSFDILVNETLGVVGESGCGKSTTGRALMQLPPPSSGSVKLDGVELTDLDPDAMRRTRLKLQMIFQDPVSSLNPRRKVKDIVAEGLTIWNSDASEVEARVNEVLSAVGFDPDLVSDRRPDQFSGGQCQRICIARALALRPKVVICDEPVSALDVSVQAQILNLLEDMKARYGLTLMFIAHDLSVVKNVSDRVMVMYLGKLCEVAEPDHLFAHPLHHYTKLLLKSIPRPDMGAALLEEELAGELPSPMHPPSGCRFRTRCPAAQARCAKEEPEMREVLPGRFVACHFPISTSP